MGVQCGASENTGLVQLLVENLAELSLDSAEGLVFRVTLGPELLVLDNKVVDRVPVFYGIRTLLMVKGVNLRHEFELREAFEKLGEKVAINVAFIAVRLHRVQSSHGAQEGVRAECFKLIRIATELLEK